MRHICYHVAVSLDGFIASEDGSINGFPEEGDHIEDYLLSLAQYDTVLMGRRTYEFGYAFGLNPGERAYPNMEHWIFSKTIDVTPASGVHLVRNHWLKTIDDLRSANGSDIYLCGGGEFAGWLLSERRIDKIKLKLCPVVFGRGIPMFGVASNSLTRFSLVDTKPYKSGVILLDYVRTE